MQPLIATDPETQSADLAAANLATLKALFPELITEGIGGSAVNVDILKQLVGDKILTDAEEKYGLNWIGKRRARQIALTPSTGTLRPCPADSVDWETTKNLMIEGDNLEVLKLLQKSYSGKVRLIYIDPPYNTGKDFVYPDNFHDSIKSYMELTGQMEGGQKISSNTEASGRFHTDWLNMMYPRLKLAWQLLDKNGVMFISIDEREYSNLRTMCCEIFGEENLMGTVVWKNATDNNPTNIATEHEYLLVVAKGRDALEKVWKSSVSDIKEVLVKVGQDLTSRYSEQSLIDAYDQWFREHKSQLWPLDRYKYIDSGGVYTGSQSVHNPGREGYRYDIPHKTTGRACKQPLMGYRFPKSTMDELLAADRILFGETEDKIVELKIYAHEYEEKLASVLELDGRLGAYDLKDDFPSEGKVFSNPKPVRLFLAFFPFLLKADGDIMVDFFAGSGASAKALMQLNSKDQIKRRFILVQLPEPLDVDNGDQKAAAKFCDIAQKPRLITEITKERLRRAGVNATAATPLFAGDVGFRVFTLASSNIRAWDPDRDKLAESLEASVEHLKTDRSEQDILFELLLKLGLDLTVPIETRSIAAHTVHSIGAGTLMVCLATSITAEQSEPLALGMAQWHTEQAPTGESTIVFRDSAFADDVTKSNLTAILHQHGLENVRSL